MLSFAVCPADRGVAVVMGSLDTGHQVLSRTEQACVCATVCVLLCYRMRARILQWVQNLRVTKCVKLDGIETFTKTVEKDVP